MKPTRFATLCVALGLAAFFNFNSHAQVTSISDAVGEINSGIATAGGTLDIVKMDVTDSTDDIIFTLTVNGNISSTDWGNFMIGIANQKTAGSTLGNGWGRPINLNAGGGNGMTHWIGSWVGGGGGSQLWTYSVGGGSGTGSNWSGPATLKSFSLSPGTQSTISYTVTKASLGVATGDTIKFDAYSSGGGPGDSAVDALANPSTSITSWSQEYTSQGANLKSYTLVNSANNTTATISFSVNLNGQIGAGIFNPATDKVTVDWGTGFTNFQYLTDADNDGVYTGSASVSALSGAPVSYRFTMEPGDIALPLISENPTRSFLMPTSSTSLSSAYFNGIEGYRDVTFTVDMSTQTTLGAFNPSTQTVEVRGPFNGWNGTQLTSQGSGIYSGTVRVSGTANQSVVYKFYTAGTAAVGYEDGGDRSFTLAFNTGLNPAPALALTTVPFFRNEARDVTFAVNMNRQISLGQFVAGTDTLEIRGAMNSWNGGALWQLTDANNDGIYIGTFSITGTSGTSLEYKFVKGASGWESVPNRSFTLGTAGVAQNVAEVYFNNDSGQTRDVTFAVDMSIQQAKGLFNPATGTVELRGIGSFGSADAKTLTRDGSTLVYKGTYAVAGDAGTAFSYKFFSSGLTASGYEIVNPADLFVNRSVNLGTSAVAQILGTSYFSNELFCVTGAPTDFSATQGTASAAQTFGVNGQGLTGDIVATAPSGFEVSSDGTTFGATANFVPSAGAVTAATLSVRMTAAGSTGARSGNVNLTSNGSLSSSLAVSGTVTAASDTTPPVITLAGSATVTVAWGGSYSDAGATATDNVDLSVTVNSSGTVNTAVPGTYTITYSATDAANNIALPVTRTVTVSKPDNTVGADGLSGLLRFAFGANGPNDSVTKPTAAVSGGNLVLTAIVRTNQTNPALTVVGQWVTNVNSFTNLSAITTVSGSASGVSQTNVPAGCERQTFTVPQGSDARKFLRLKAEM